jgi:glucose-6-phosphate 1-dehydrogenase
VYNRDMQTKLLIFGITGDLSRRKLLPALRDIVKSGECEPLSIIGVSRRDVDIPELVTAATGDDNLVERTRVVTMDLAKADDYTRLKDEVALSDDEQLVIYLSVPPSAATDIVDFLGEAGLNTLNVKIMFEKPFGFDVATAQEFIERTRRYFTEAQIYRIDHYMAKEVALELLKLRTDAANHHHAWSSQTVESIEIIASETLGVEDRADFYEQTGALRDLVQGHLLQLLSLVLMDVSGSFTLEDLPARRLAALEQLSVVDPLQTTRAQYDGYGEAVSNPGSTTETFARLKVTSDDLRWQGVPVTITTGKKLAAKTTAIIVHYKDGTQDEFIEGAIHLPGERLRDGYERVLVEAINGRKYIFTTSPEIIRAWQVLAHVQDAWAMDARPLLTYTPGATAEMVS